MRTIRPICLFIILLTTLVPSYAQKLTTGDLIKAWNTSDATQTARAEATYLDLKNNTDASAFKSRLGELNAYLSKHTSRRLQARTIMYEILGKEELAEHPFTDNDYDKIKQAIIIAGLMNDKQLLSELYSLYADHNSAHDTETKLLYDLQAINIQKQIGLSRFPLVYVRFLTASLALYNTMDYRQCIRYGTECLLLMKSPRTNLPDYVLQLDNIGSAYRALDMPDSVIYYYRQIQQVLGNYRADTAGYYIPANTPADFIRIWTGVAQGGVAQGLFLQGKYDEAYPMLLQNIQTSIATAQLGDASLAQNTLANIYFIRKEYASALSAWQQAYAWAADVNDLQNTIHAIEGITKAYAAAGRYDSAYAYGNKYVTLHDTLQAQISRSRLATVNARIEYNNLQSDLSHSKEAVNRQVRLRNIILMAVVFLFVIALLLYNRSRLRHNLRQERLEKEKESAQAEIARARGQLEDFARNISEKNKLIEHLRARFDMEADAGATTALRNFTILTEEDWQQFKDAFEKANPGFWQRLSEKFPGLTPAEQRFTALIRLGLSNKEMAAATGVSAETVRSVLSRMRKKLNLTDADHTRSLVQEI